MSQVQYAEELDLLGLEVSPVKAKSTGGGFGNSDPFGNDPFGDEAASAPPAAPQYHAHTPPKPSAVKSLFDVSMMIFCVCCVCVCL